MQPVEQAEYEGVDYAWVMQTTFVVTIVVGAPVVALLSTVVALDSWGARAAFAVRVGAPIWFVTAVAVALYAKRNEVGGDGAEENADGADTEGADGGTEESAEDDGESGERDGESGERDEPATDGPEGSG